MDQKQLNKLIEKYMDGTASEQERILLESWYLHLSKEPGDRLSEEKLQHNLDEISSNLPLPLSLPAEKKSQRLWPTVWKAAAVILVAAVALYVYQQRTNVQDVEENERVAIFSPNPNEATITLADGRKLIMSEVAKGEVATEGNVLIKKNADGEVIYDVAAMQGMTPSINTLTTPRGGTFSIRLSDGTKVTLNAASTLKYPTSFVGERKVELIGEAFFEVSHDKKNRFVVSSKGQEVEVLGTQFNINSYGDGKIAKTTLLEGSVLIKSLRMGVKLGEQKLIPGEQAKVNDFGRIVTEKVNTDDVIAWMDGKIIFDDETIGNVMRKICLWYDVEVVYEGAVEKRKIAGVLSRADDIDTVLDKIAFTGAAKFKKQGRRIIVMQ